MSTRDEFSQLTQDNLSDRARILVSAVAVAQLVESRIVIPVVAGSSPVSHPISLGYVLTYCLDLSIILPLNQRIIGLKKCLV